MKKQAYVQPQNIQEAIVECQPSINKLVKKWTRNHYWMREDLQQLAIVAIHDAYDRYDRSSENKFSTYAYFRINCYLSDYAQPEWERMNSINEYDANTSDDYYEMNIDTQIDLERKLSKIDEVSIEVFNLRMEGETFSGIANRLKGIRNLQHARNTFIEVESQLKEYI